MDAEEEQHGAWAARIERAGWRQCSVFRPSPDDCHLIPAYLELKDTEWLVVATQSCSLCDANFVREPLFEVMVGSPLARYNPNHDNARGKNNRVFHLPLYGLPGAAALACHIGRRAFLPRNCLPTRRPEKTWTDQKDLDAFKGWLANYYMRIALPNTLVDRLREPSGISDIMKAAFKADLDGAEAQAGVNSVYIRISTEEELPPHKVYTISLVVVCDDENTKEFLDRQLADLMGRPSAPLWLHWVAVESLKIETADNVTLADLSGHSRFNEWDELSTLNTRLVNMRSAV